MIWTDFLFLRYRIEYINADHSFDNAYSLKINLMMLRNNLTHLKFIQSLMS